MDLAHYTSDEATQFARGYAAARDGWPYEVGACNAWREGWEYWRAYGRHVTRPAPRVYRARSWSYRANDAAI